MKEEKQVAEQIIDFLEENKGKAFSYRELVEIMDVAAKAVRLKLKNLIKHNEINFERISGRIARKIYKNPDLKRGMRLYFLE